MDSTKPRNGLIEELSSYYLHALRVVVWDYLLDEVSDFRCLDCDQVTEQLLTEVLSFRAGETGVGDPVLEAGVRRGHPVCQGVG